MKKTISVGTMFLLFFLYMPSYAQNVHVLVNIWDGAEYSKVQDSYKNNLLPNLASIGPLRHLTSNEDCFEGTCMKTHTMPQHATMLTGCLADVHKVYSNLNYQLIPDNITVPELIKINYPEVKVAQISGKRNYFGHYTFGNVMSEIDLYMESHLLEPDLSYALTLQLIKRWKQKSYFIVIHFRNPDAMGHVYGSDSIEYSDSIKTNDILLGKILNAMRGNEQDTESFVYVVSDHGFGCPSLKEHNCSPNTFIVSNNPALDHGIYMRQVANYLLSHFNLQPSCK